MCVCSCPRACSAYKAGDELLASYDHDFARKCNAALLLKYGFVSSHPLSHCHSIQLSFNRTSARHGDLKAVMLQNMVCVCVCVCASRHVCVNFPLQVRADVCVATLCVCVCVCLHEYE